MRKIVLEVRLYATLRKYTTVKDGVFPYSVDDGDRVEDLLKNLKIGVDEVKLIMINGRAAETDHFLNNGDRVGIFPPIGGG